MTTPRILDRIRALLARAAHPTTPEEEARTSAVQAARLIGKHEVAIGVPAVEVRVAWRAPEPSSWTGSSTARSGFHCRYRAAKAGRCQECKKSFAKGEEVGWRNPIGPVHLDC